MLLRLKTSVALFVMALEVESDPVEPPLPIWSVPAVILVAPVYVLFPDRTQVPDELLTMETVPLVLSITAP